MLINATKSRLVIGRFSILPGEKVPAFQLTEEEAAAVDKFKSAGRLVEKPGHNAVEAAPVAEKSGSNVVEEAPAAEKSGSNVVEEAPAAEKSGSNVVEEAPAAEKPAPKAAGRSRRQSVESAEEKPTEHDANEGVNADSQSSAEQVSTPSGE